MIRHPAVRSAALRCLRWAVPFVACCFTPLGGACATQGWGFLLFAPMAPVGFSNGNDRTSQVPGEPTCTCPALRPRWDRRVRPLRRFDAAFRLLYSVGSHKNGFYGAPSHGPNFRCLRFAGWITPPPRKTRFRLSATLCRTGLVTRRVPMKVSAIHASHPPSPSFPGAHKTNPSIRVFNPKNADGMQPHPSIWRTDKMGPQSG
jgi:hypothetical protein